MSPEGATWQFDAAIPWVDETFHQIVQFYLFECPAPGTSVRGSSFETLGWKGRKPLAALKKAMFESASGSLVYKSCETKAEVIAAVRELGILDDVKLTEEYVVFFKNRDRNMDALYGHIRNAFAHGRFSIWEHAGNAVYVLQDDYHGLTARAILRASTLVNWARIVRDTPRGLGHSAESEA